MGALLIREPKRADGFWEHYTDIGHNHSKTNEDYDWLWIWVGGCIIKEVRPVGYTHSQMSLPEDIDYYNCYRGSYDVEKQIISLAKPGSREILSFRSIPIRIVKELGRAFPEASCIIDFGV